MDYKLKTLGVLPQLEVSFQPSFSFFFLMREALSYTP
jgi:hypothetical protein